MRGKEVSFDCAVCNAGITPAYAGKRVLVRRHANGFQDHPRLCGEKLSVYATAESNTGSPPPMRGKVLYAGMTTAKTRITPAYAGKRAHGRSRCLWLTDHPRLCGEKQTRLDPVSAPAGSPPPMRGKVLFVKIY